jgi:hypothetical protein
MLVLIVLMIAITANVGYSQAHHKKSKKYSHNIYWAVKKNTASGKHNYMYATWNCYPNCATYKRNPIKLKTYRRYANWKRTTV